MRDVLYVVGAVPGSPGTFVRVVDAVKGPYFPEGRPVPRPTYLPSGQQEGKEEEGEVFMPLPEGDALKDVEHPNPEQY